MGLSSDRRSQIEQALSRLKESDVAPSFKLEMLQTIVSDTLPWQYHARSTIASQNTKTVTSEEVSRLISTVLITLPLFEDEPKPLKINDDIPRQIEMEVRQSLNEKFARSPAFMLLLAIVGVGVTMFGYGLYSFNSDVKRADQVTREFESKLNEADAKILSSQRELTKRLNGEIDGAVLRINEMQSNSLKALSADLERRINEVEGKKRDAIEKIGVQLTDFQQEKRDAVESVKSQASKMEPQITDATSKAVGAIEKETGEKIREFQKRADQTVAELGKPAVKMVLGRSYFFILAGFITAIVALLVSAVALARTW